MTAKRHGVRNKVEFADDDWKTIDAQAEVLDLPVSSFVRAIVLGAIAKGTASDLAIYAIDKKLTTNRNRRQRVRLPWVSDGENWHLDEWTLVRTGAREKADRFRKPGEGWFLHGPEFDPPLELMTMSRSVAVDKANDLLLQRKLYDPKS